MFSITSTVSVLFCVVIFLRINVHSNDLNPNKCKKEVPTSTLPRQTSIVPHGNGSTPFLSIIQICCDGYKSYEYDRNICIPDCGPKCTNGFCISPNVCQCFPDQVKDLNGECSPTCPIRCLNGRCTSNGTYVCNSGFDLSSDGKFCIPKCPQGCDSWKNCTSSGVCNCTKGYVAGNNGNSIRVYTLDCLHGECVGPGMCSCYPGYVLRSGICQAQCSQNCENGLCISENLCLCNRGFKFDIMTHRCVPQCRNCLNGVCIAPELCHCFQGYQWADGRCKSICKGGCLYGRCIAPNKCVCRSNYRIITEYVKVAVISERKNLV